VSKDEEEEAELDVGGTTFPPPALEEGVDGLEEALDECTTAGADAADAADTADAADAAAELPTDDIAVENGRGEPPDELDERVMTRPVKAEEELSWIIPNVLGTVIGPTEGMLVIQDEIALNESWETSTSDGQAPLL